MKWLVKDDLNLWFFIKASEENELRNETYWELSWGKRERERERTNLIEDLAEKKKMGSV